MVLRILFKMILISKYISFTVF